MPSPFTSRVNTAPNVMLRVIGEEAVILNLKNELYLGLDPIGTRMWMVLRSAPSIQAAYELLLAEFEVETERLRSDLDKLLDQMLEQGLIELKPVESA
jgi:hypothetical protein